MKLVERVLPPGHRFRELWLPEQVVANATLLNVVHGGHEAALTGARKGTSTDGVHCVIAVNGSVDLGAIHNAAAKWAVSFRFKLGYNSVAGLGDKYWFCKHLIGTDKLWIFFNDASGSLRATLVTGGVTSWNFTFSQATYGFYAGVWYHFYLAIGQAIGGGAATDGARMRINNGVAEVDANMDPLPNGGPFILNDIAVAGQGTYDVTFADVYMLTRDVTETEEEELYKGIPPADVVNAWMFDEGRGVTAVDRGTGGNNGTLRALCTWAYGACKQAVLSLDGIDDHVESSAGVDITGDLSLLAVVKAKSAYDGLGADRYLVHAFRDASNELRIYYDNAADVIRFHAEGIATAQTVDYSTKPTIDDYLILILTLTAAGDLEGFVNGVSVGTASGVGAIIGVPATVYIGAEQTPGDYDISKPLLVGLIEGALSRNEAKQTSRLINNMLGLGLTI